MDPNLRNLKDFLTLYNKITEICFSRCVNNLFERNLDTQESSCVDKCVLKFAAFNQKMMSVYVEVQTQVNQRRLKEVEEAQKLQEQQGQQLPQSQEPVGTTTSLPNQGQGGTQNAYA